MDNSSKNNLSAFWLQPKMLMAAMFLLGTLIFLPTVNYDFVWDDNLLFTPENLSSPNWSRLIVSRVPFPNESESLRYLPLPMFTSAIEYIFYKENPRGYHLSSTIIHGINSSLVAYLALLLFKNPYAALIAGALFALHPVHPEAVAFLGGRVDILATLFSLLALITIVKEKKNNREWSTLALASIFFFLALLSKETALVIIIPLAAFLYQKSQPESRKLPAIALKIIPFGLVLILYAFLRHQAVSTSMLSKLKLTISPFFLFEQFLRYQLFLIFPPQRSSYFFEVPTPLPYLYPLGLKFGIIVVLNFLLISAIIYVIYRKRETMPYFMLLVLPCFPPLLYSIYIPGIALDRYLYLPTAGLALLAAWGFLQVPKNMKKWAAGGMALILAAYLGGVWWRTPVWKNEVTLFETLKQEYPASPYIRACLGQAYHKQKRFWEALQELSAAVNLEPEHPLYHTYLGWLYLRLGWAEKARQEFSLALNIVPDYSLALEGTGIAWAQKGSYELALQYLDRAAAADPKNESILKNRNLVARQKEASRK